MCSCAATRYAPKCSYSSLAISFRFDDALRKPDNSFLLSLSSTGRPLLRVLTIDECLKHSFL